MTRRFLPALAAAATLALGAGAHAQTTVPTYPATAYPGGTGNAANFSAHKQKELSKIQMKMQTLNTLQSCVNAAGSSDAIRQCNETARAANGGAHEKHC